jgi:hypothetical protein
MITRNSFGSKYVTVPTGNIRCWIIIVNLKSFFINWGVARRPSPNCTSGFIYTRGITVNKLRSDIQILQLYPVTYSIRPTQKSVVHTTHITKGFKPWDICHLCRHVHMWNK